MTSLVIHAATIHDIPAIVRIRLTALTEDEIRGFSVPEFATYSSTDELRKIWAGENWLQNGFRVFIAEDEGHIVGFIVFKMECDYGCIDNIVVAKDEQGRGIGTALVAHVENIAQAQGCTSMKTETTENADGVPWKAYSFWIRMGYEDTGQRLPTNYDFMEIPLRKQFRKSAIDQNEC
jgi:ribosomal protein S18 acetylase RimI-like enzyme